MLLLLSDQFFVERDHGISDTEIAILNFNLLLLDHALRCHISTGREQI